MKKLTTVLSVLALSIIFSACNNQDILNRALKAIQRNDVEAFQGATTGAARAKYGTPNGLAELNAKLAGLSDIELVDEKLVATKQGHQGHGRYGDVLRVYQGEVTAKQSAKASATHLATVTTDCTVTVKLEWDSTCPRGRPVLAPSPNDRFGCIGGMRIRERQHCLISDLQL